MENYIFIKDTELSSHPKRVVRTFYELIDEQKRINYDNLKNIIFREKSDDGEIISEIKIPKELFSICEEDLNILERMHHKELKNKIK